MSRASAYRPCDAYSSAIVSVTTGSGSRIPGSSSSADTSSGKISGSSSASFAAGGVAGAMAELAWARPWMKDQKVGPKPKAPSDVLAPGDVARALAPHLGVPTAAPPAEAETKARPVLRRPPIRRRVVPPRAPG